jgi:hypothetical protein
MSFILIGFASLAQTQVVYEDDFEGYDVGDYIAVENPTWWETWSNNPGSAEDALITDVQANSGANSFEVVGSTDLILKLGDKTTGLWEVSWNMYVPAGLAGYYNFQHFEAPGVEWAVEVYFNADATAQLNANGENIPFTYTQDSWMQVVNMIDLDKDSAQVWIDGVMIHQWQWSTQASGGAGANQLGGVDFFAGAQGSDVPDYFIDDVYVAQIFEPLFFDDIEDYTLGDYMAVANPTWYDTWSSNPGSAEDALIVDEQAFSGTQSFKVDGSTDLILKLGDQISGKFAVNWMMYIPAGFAGYYNFQHFEAPGVEWAVELYFNADGTGQLNADGANIAFTYDQDTWMEIDHTIDLDNDSAFMYLDGVMIHEWIWSTQASGGAGANQLGGVDFFAGAQGSDVPTYYVDDVEYLQLGGTTDPAVAVTPEAIETNVVEGFTGEETLSVGNVGAAALDYELAIVYNLDAKAEALPLVNKYSNVTPDQYAVTQTKPGGQAPQTDEEVLTYCDENTGSAIGLTSAGVEWEIAAKWPASVMYEFAGMELTSVLVYINEVNPDDEFTLRVYGMDLDYIPGDLLHEQSFTPLAASWNQITLTTPVVCTGEDLWVGYLIYQSLASYPAGAGCEPANLNGDWIRSGPGWGHLSDNPELPYNWNIVAYLNGEPITHWLSADPMMGSVDPGASEDVTVMFDATTLATGTYQADIVVFSNDPENKSVTVPITMNVNPVSIDELLSEESFVVFPNPAKDYVTIQSNESIAQVKIYNYVGQLIDQVKIDNDKATLSTDGYQPGIYFIHVETAQGWSTRKIVIE